MRKRIFIDIPALAIILFLFVMGCSNHIGEEHKASDLALMKTTSPPPIELKKRDEDKSIAYQVRQEVKKIDEIYDVAIIEGKKHVIVAYKVKHLHRFRMKQIEKRLTKKLNEEYPDDEFIVSSDYKIFLEAVRLKEDLDNTNISDEEAGKRFRKIIELKEELT